MLAGQLSIGGQADNNIFSIIASVQNDIKSLKTQLENIPAFPKGILIKI